MRRAMTMVETLLSIGLLALVMLGGAQWLNVAASTQNGSVDRTQWRHAAERALDLIHDSVHAGDLPNDEPLARVRVADNRLRISTRSIAGANGPEDQVYEYDEETGRLVLQVRSVDGKESTRLLLPYVQSWTCAIDEDVLVLRVEVTSSTGEAVVRRIKL